MKKISILLFSVFSLVTATQAQPYNLIGTLSGHEHKVQNLCYSPDGEMLVSGDRDGNLILWSLSDQKVIRKWKGHEAIVVDFDFSPFGDKLATASTDGSVKVWELMTGDLLGTYYNEKVVYGDKEAGWAVSFSIFSKDGRYLYFGGDGATIFRVKLGKNTRKELFKPESVYTYPVKHFDRDKMQRITGGELLPSGRQLVCTIGYYIKVIDLASGTELQSMYYSKEPLNDVVYGPERGQVTSWSFDGFATTWSLKTGELLKSYHAGDYLEICAPSFSMDRKLMATAASGHEAHVWSIEKQTEVANLLGHKEIVRIAKFSPTANIIATASFDGTVKLWEGPEMEKPIDAIEEDPFYSDNGEVIVAPEELALPVLWFDQSEYTLRRASRIALAQVARIMLRNAELQLRIEGHTDNVGNPYVNLRLSKRRAIVVRNFLIEQGVDESRVVIGAHGSDKPLARNINEAFKSKNRRVEMQFEI